jgi:hypothetical protein
MTHPLWVVEDRKGCRGLAIIGVQHLINVLTLGNYALVGAAMSKPQTIQPFLEICLILQ